MKHAKYLTPHEQAMRATNARDPNKIRGIDPTTTEHDYTRDEVEFAMALESYKQKTGRRFPTNHEILLVIRSLGYQKIGMNA